MNLLIMGLPGAGKGTQAAKMVEEFGLAHLSTGDMFRAAIANETEMGLLAKSYMDQGQLVPDEVTNGIVKERLQQADIAEKGFLLDGYPRTIEQAHALDQALEELQISLDGVINIDVDPSILLERLSGRFICRTCGATYHKVFSPTTVEGTCDNCGGHDFYQREDDKPEAIKTRLDVNIAQGQPIIEHYTAKDMVFDIQGDQEIEQVFADIQAAVEKIK